MVFEARDDCDLRCSSQEIESMGFDKDLNEEMLWFLKH